jgi:hypothetical protein
MEVEAEAGARPVAVAKGSELLRVVVDPLPLSTEDGCDRRRVQDAVAPGGGADDQSALDEYVGERAHLELGEFHSPASSMTAASASINQSSSSVRVSTSVAHQAARRNALSLFVMGHRAGDSIYEEEMRTWVLTVDPVGERSPTPHEHIRLYLSGEDETLHVVTASDVLSDEDLAFEEAATTSLDSLASRWSATVFVGHDAGWRNRFAVHARLIDAERSADELVDVGEEIRAVLVAAQGGQMALEGARHLALAGHVAALAGTPESQWLDAKSDPYRLREDRHKWELAKDVAAFANVIGGLIIIPATTIQRLGREVVDQVKTVPRDTVDERQYRDTIASWVYPAPVGVEVVFVASRDDSERGQLVIFVAPQAEDRKPFLVRGDAQPDRVYSNGITVPRRDGDHICFEDVGHVYAALRAVRQQAAAQDAILEGVHLDALPPRFRHVYHAAREAGLQTQLYSGGFRIDLPGELPLDVTAADLHPNIEELALHTAMERLAMHGVPARRTARGRLVPDVAEPYR